MAKLPPVIRSINEATEHEVENTRGTSIQILLGPEDGVPNFATRCFTIKPGGRIPSHRHDFIEHEQVVLAGEMVLGLDDKEVTVKEGDSVFIPAYVAHWYENRSELEVKFICVVPCTKTYQTEWLDEGDKA